MRKGQLLLLEIIFILVCVVFFLPVVFVVINTLKGYAAILINPLALPKPISFDNYVKTWNQTSFPLVFLNSVVVTGGSTAGIILFASMAGYKLSRVATKLSGLLFLYFLVATMVPFIAVMLPVVKLAAAIGIGNSRIGLILINVGFSCSFAILLYHGFTKSIPRELDESAIIDGCSAFRLYFSVIFPVLRPISTTVAILMSIQFWNDLLLPLVLITEPNIYTIPLSQLAFFGQFGQNRINLLLTSGIFASAPAIVVYVFVQRYIIRGITAGAVKF